MTETVRVSCAIIFHDSRIFAARRGKSQSQPLKWEFPGGKLEQGETPEQCLLRELSEELGMKAVIIEKIRPFYYDYPEFTIELLPFVCKLPEMVYSAVEHDRTGWFTPQEIGELEFTRADIPLLNYVINNILPRYS